jgi:hypothetical protein
MQLRSAVWVISIGFALANVSCGGGNTSNSKPTTPASPPTATSITLSPQNSAVTVGKTLQFKATAKFSDGSTKDISSTANWSSSNQAVATVSAGLVTAMKLGVVTVGVSSGSVNASTLLNVTSKNFSNASLNGAYAFTLTGTDATQKLRFEAGSLSAAGNGKISGVEDINSSSGVTTGVSLSGTYSITPDGRGTLTFGGGQSSRTFHFVLSSNSSSPSDNNGKLIEFDTRLTAIGTLEKQDETSFKNASLANTTYVFRVGGADSSQNPISTVGAFTTDATGLIINSGNEDVNDNGTINNGSMSTTGVPITSGTIGSVDSSTGRTTATVVTGSGTSNFAFYLVSSSKTRIIELDTAPIAAGVAEKQDSPAPSSATAGGYDFLTEIGGTSGQFWIMGQFKLDSTAHIDSLAQNQAGGIVLNFALPAGTLNVSTNGRGTFQENTSQGTRNFTLYTVSLSKMFLLETDTPHAASGVAELQDPGVDGFLTSTLNNSFIVSAADTSGSNVALVAQVVVDGLGHITGIEDVSQPQPGNPSQITVSTVALDADYSSPQPTTGLTMASVNISPNNTALQTLNLYLISSNAALVLGLSPTNVNGMLVLQ